MPTYEESRDRTRAQWNEFSGGWKKWDQQVVEGFRDQGEARLGALPGSEHAGRIRCASGFLSSRGPEH